MRLESRTWFLLSVLFLIGAVYFWRRGDEYEHQKKARIQQQRSITNSLKSPASSNPAPFKLLSQAIPRPSAPGPTAQGPSSPNAAPSSSPSSKNKFPLRLTNTDQPFKDLSHSDTAILMRNAFIDTAKERKLAIPEHLKAESNPGSYIVQAHGAIREGFRQRLRIVGAEFVAYVPHNAFLVQLSAEGARRLEAAPEVQAVLPYEPYYKLDSKLLPTAVEQKLLEEQQWLRVTVFPGQDQAAEAGLGLLGAEIMEQEATPFGPRFLVKPVPDSLPAIARLSSVQTVELSHKRELMNDLTRVALGIAPNGVTNANYLNLTGTNVMVNVADSGVDASHPDLAGRVLGDTPKVLTDFVGHGTHVAGILAGSGSRSSTVKTPPDGSETNANFRGMAPAARIFTLPFQAYPEVSRGLNDTYLQQTAARTNIAMSRRPAGPMVSNNSWGYTGETEYDSSSASYDAAVRDALDDVAGAQSLIFVFAAGNSGEGTDQGEGGQANSIPSPANAKNVIAVGAVEQLRNITTSASSTNDDDTVNTNAIFLGVSDSSDQIAAFSSRGNVGIGTEGEFGRFKPDVVAPGTFVIAPRAKEWKLENDLDTNSPQYEILRKVNEPLAPSYRYESGTSQAAPAVSGLLALMQEFFEQRLPLSLRRTNSPALMKALLINGARPVGSFYDYQVQNSINYQGWGLPNITNSLPSMLLNQPETAWPIRMVDQSATNAVATGQSRSWQVNVSTNAQDIPMRVTLVWTDPPGNPNAAIKLVNDLDLVVSNTVSGEVYYGNDIQAGSDFSHPTLPDETPILDNVNNVENVFIPTPASTNLVVTVVGRRVNVTANQTYNAATGQPNDVVQDFALVISTDDTTLTNAFSFTFGAPQPAPLPAPVTIMTNGVPLLNRRAGANPPILNVREGITNQWNFYVFTNLYITNDISTLTNGTNVAFVTFLPPNVGEPRVLSSDIDLYVSKDPRFLTLEPSVVDGAFKSITRGGTEAVVFTNAALGDVFYIGVKSEDQQSGEYGFIALSSDTPFSQDKNGNKVLNGLPVPQAIPDGTPGIPGLATIIAIGIDPITVKRVTVTTTLTHQDFGDLTSTLTHEQTSVVLHNHTLHSISGTNVVFVYDDQSFGETVGQHTDGPGTLNDFGGETGNGVWMLNVIDSAPFYTGRVDNVTIQLQPFINQDLLAAGSAGISGSVPPNDAVCFYVDVPPEATNMVLHLSQLNGPLDVLLEHGAIPSTNSFKKSQMVLPPGGDVSIGSEDHPPIQAGRYFVCLYNPSTTATVNFHIFLELQFGVGLDYQRTLINTNALPLLDQGMITSTVDVPVDKEVADVEVSVRIDHPRSADLVLHLISPQGTRLLLAENRGGSDSRGYGSGTGTNITYTIFTENTNLLSNLEPIKFSLPPWTNLNANTNLPIFSEEFETAVPGPFLTNETFSKWTVTQGQVVVHTIGDGLAVLPHFGTNFLELDTTDGPSEISTSFPTIPNRDYVLNLFYQRNPSATIGNTNLLQVSYGGGTNSPGTNVVIDVASFGWQSTNINFTATDNVTQLRLGATNAFGALLDTITVTEAVRPTNIYVLPEESLTLLQGERALGTWTLEVMDNRAGPAGSDTGSLIDWHLQVKYGNPAYRAIALTNGVPYSSVVLTNQTNYFVIDVCESVSTAFISLSGPTNLLNLLVDRQSFPVGDDIHDDFFPIVNFLRIDDSSDQGFAGLTLTSDPHQPAPLIPGGRLYLAVHNLDPNPDDTNSLALMTNNFTIQVSFDHDTCTRERPIIRLHNDVAYTNLLAPAGILTDYYVFNVTPTAIQAEFEVRPRNGDVGLLLRRGLPLPGLTNYDYRSDLPGLTNELIVLTNASQPVALAPGDWYLGVYNNSTNAVVYDIRAREILDTNYNLIVLTNGISTNYTIAQGSKLTNYFIFRIFDPSPGVKFELFNLNANADMLIGFNSLPTYTNNFMSNSASPALPLTVEVRTNDTLTDITGSWLLSIIAKDPTNLSFTVRATLLDNLTNTPPATNRVFDPDITINGTNICFSWDTTVGLQYRLEGKETIVDTNWSVIYGPFVATNSTASFCTNLFGNPYHFFQVVELGSGTNPPPQGDVVESTLTVGTNGVCLAWASDIGMNYFVEAKVEITDNTWTNVSGRITAVATNTTYCLPLTSPYHYFQVIREAGEVTPPPGTNGPVVPAGLTVSTNGACLSWTSITGTNYFVEGKQTITDKAWTNISGTITAVSTNTTYCVPLASPYHFFQVIQEVSTNTVPPGPTNGPAASASLALTTNGICLSWTAGIGTNYFIAAKRTIVDPAWTNIATVTATQTNETFCVPTNSPYHFFEVLIQAGSTNSPSGTNTNEVTLRSPLVLTNGRVQLSWNAQIGAVYQVQVATNLIPVIRWNTITNITATTSPVTFTDSSTVTNSVMRFYRVIRP